MVMLELHMNIIKRHYSNYGKFNFVSAHYCFSDGSCGELTFNSLGEIVKLVGINSEKASRAIRKISSSLAIIYKTYQIPHSYITNVY